MAEILRIGSKIYFYLSIGTISPKMHRNVRDTERYYFCLEYNFLYMPKHSLLVTAYQSLSVMLKFHKNTLWDHSGPRNCCEEEHASNSVCIDSFLSELLLYL